MKKSDSDPKKDKRFDLKTERFLDEVHKFANDYARQKIETALNEIEDTLFIEDGVKWDRERVRGTIGGILAKGYAIGYADRHNKFKTLKVVK